MNQDVAVRGVLVVVDEEDLSFPRSFARRSRTSLVSRNHA